MEHAGGVEVPGILVDLVEFRQDVTHRAEFVLRIAAAVRAEYTVDLPGIEPREPFAEVVRHPGGHVEGLPVADVGMGVDEARHDLLDRVIRHPDAPGVGPGLAFELVEGGRGKRGQVAILIQALLACRELGHEVVDAVAKPQASGCRRHARRGGQIVPCHVPTQEFTVPAVVALLDACFLGKFRQRAVVVKQFVGIIGREHPRAMQLLPDVERASRQQAHLIGQEGTRRVDRHGRRKLAEVAGDAMRRERREGGFEHRTAGEGHRKAFRKKTASGKHRRRSKAGTRPATREKITGCRTCSAS